MKKGNLFTTIVFIFSIMLLIVSGAIFVYSAQQQSVSSSLQVTFSGENVNFSAQGWYQVHGANSRTELVDNDLDNDNIVTFSATDAPNTVRTLKISNTESENKAILTSQHSYVLFTYQFTNTASEGAFGMEVSLSITPSPTNLKAITYYSSTTLYTEANLDTFKSSVSGTSTFSNEFIVANNGTKYFYILFEIDDLTLPVTFNPTFSWTVVCSDSVTAPQPQPFNISGTTLTGLTADGALQTSLTIPNTVTTLGAGAFDNVNPNLTSLTIPSSVTTIAATALQHVQFDTIHLDNWTAQNKIDRLDEKKVATGMYPQTVYYNNGSYTPAGLTATGKTYTTDVGSSTVTLTEYSSTDGNKYAMLSSATYRSGTPILSGSGLAGPTGTALYFKVEPIIVTIKTVSNTGECYFLADKLLGSKEYDSNGKPHWYNENSESDTQLRAYLNGTFRTDAGLSSRLTTTHTVYNNEPGPEKYNVQETSNDTTNTSDYIWLPSYYEMMNGGGLGYSSDNTERKCEATDLAVATYTYVSRTDNTNYGAYFLRSASSIEFFVSYVDSDGYVYDDYNDPINPGIGFRVAFAFNL